MRGPKRHALRGPRVHLLGNNRRGRRSGGDHRGGDRRVGLYPPRPGGDSGAAIPAQRHHRGTRHRVPMRADQPQDPLFRAHRRHDDHQGGKRLPHRPPGHRPGLPARHHRLGPDHQARARVRLAGPLHVRVERGEGRSADDDDELRSKLAQAISDMCRVRARVEIVSFGTYPSPGRKKVRIIEKVYET